MRVLSIGFWIGAVAALIKGFHKMLAYTNFDASEYPTLAEKNVNAYVGGDAYNMIISGNHATGYFVLFGSLLLAGLMVEDAIKERESVKEEIKATEGEIENV